MEENMSGQIYMSTKEQQRVVVLEQLIRKEIKSTQAAKLLGVTQRQVRRQKKRYQQEGVKGLVHKSRGKESNHKIDQIEIDRVMKIVREQYYDFGPTFALEKLQQFHMVTFKVERLRQAMVNTGIWRSKKRRKASIHQMRERRNFEGELVQIDGSPHDWFEGRGDVGICTLLVFIDDATSKILWLEFCSLESTLSYFQAMEGYLIKHGRPLAFYSDKHGVFRVNKMQDGMNQETVGITQFGRAMKELDIEMLFANTPQAKGRVERVNETLQDRLVKELRLRGISSIKEANKFVQEIYVDQFNYQFAVTPVKKTNFHRPLLSTQKLSQILTIRETRVVSKNLSIQYDQILYQIQTKRSAYTLRGKKICVKQDQKGKITLWDGNQQLQYTTLKKQPRQIVADSKILTAIMNEKVKRYKKPQNWWETPLEQMTDEIYF
jgi:transposase